MDVIEAYDRNDPESPKKVLIATQGSKFKYAVTNKLVDELDHNDVYIKVIDVTNIEGVKVSDWDAIIIIHTWEMWAPQPDAEKFLSANYNPEKIFVLATSGGGEEMIEGVDGISGQSIIEEADQKAESIYSWLLMTLYKQ